jgi:hypothetical protein
MVFLTSEKENIHVFLIYVPFKAQIIIKLKIEVVFLINFSKLR